MVNYIVFAHDELSAALVYFTVTVGKICKLVCCVFQLIIA